MTLTEQIVVFRTGRSYEVLMVLNELKAAGVPAFGQQEAGGIVTEMPASPVPGPDVTWLVRVPQPAAEDARSIIAGLPVDADQQPGPLHFGPSARSHRVLWVMAAVFLLMMLFSLVDQSIDWLSG